MGAARLVTPRSDLDEIPTELLEPPLDGLQPGGHGFWSAQVAPALERLVVAPPPHPAPPFWPRPAPARLLRLARAGGSFDSGGSGWPGRCFRRISSSAARTS